MFSLKRSSQKTFLISRLVYKPHLYIANNTIDLTFGIYLVIEILKSNVCGNQFWTDLKFLKLLVETIKYM